MRGRRIALVAHCVFNQNAVLTGWERATGTFNATVSDLMRQGLGLVQLPCPELTFLGVDRPPMTYEEYDTPEYREHCRTLLAPVLAQLQRLLEDGCTLEVLLGIEESPSCDLRQGKGVFMEELYQLLPEGSLPIIRQMIPECHQEDES